ncbi:hypothetical protein MPTK1_6g00590 [Marchantia polymorpha subsp. ruderalis]|uniref:Rhodanese domain-containing protein n=3 Tax=Marchantia polymorpha TaxID=3197 RepID=A0AAF6BM43_MARPO|nr:hypothetical protein MARPO_0104s0007 [Marchantia polymorpha]BBN13077.1 hypothetical protein Mp_6g00590 [Marchantia polymorpha subsp. ruderalis]|eukprot:PTQ31968.1 hypothetical protein MARPO_0104s0007 [Marchantia polymorpha]
MARAMQMAGAAVAGAPTKSAFVSGTPVPDLRRVQLSAPRRSVSVVAKRGECDEGKKLPVAVTLTSSMLMFLQSAAAAQALSRQDVEDAFTKVEEITGTVTSTAGTAYDATKNIFDKVLTTVKPGIDIAAPLVQKTAETVTKYASPLASDAAREAQKALKNAGVDTEPVLEFGKSAVDQTSSALNAAKPLGSSFLESALAADPLFLAEAAGGLVLVYLFAPALLSGLGDAARGYSGDLTAAQALDLLLKQDYTIVDIRSEKEKSRSGIPSLPSNVKNKYIAVPVEELPGKVRNQIRNSRKVEAEVAALKIAYLKKLNKGSRIVIIDESGDIAKTVAKSLRGQGFKNTWVVVDGFKGGRGWVQSRLGTDNYGSSSFAEVLSPSRIIPARFGTTRGTTRLLPGGADD